MMPFEKPTPSNRVASCFWASKKGEVPASRLAWWTGAWAKGPHGRDITAMGWERGRAQFRGGARVPKCAKHLAWLTDPCECASVKKHARNINCT